MPESSPDQDKESPAENSLEVRKRLTHALELDLIGPDNDHQQANERLPGHIRPSNWYLTGFLVPSGAAQEEAAKNDEDDELDDVPEVMDLGEDTGVDRRAAKKSFLPSSMGLSFLVEEQVDQLQVTISWGDYSLVEYAEEDKPPARVWQRTPKRTELPILLTGPGEHPVPESGGLVLHLSVRDVDAERVPDLPTGTRGVSLFLVNKRRPDLEHSDPTYAFQAKISVRSDHGFIPRTDPRGVIAGDWDGRVSDLHYADTPAYATGHGVSADWDFEDGVCQHLQTVWIPQVSVERTLTAEVKDVVLSLDDLGQLADGEAARKALTPLVVRYREWIAERRDQVDSFSGDHRETAVVLLDQAEQAAQRIEDGLRVLEQGADALDAFRVANRAIAKALRQRMPDRFTEEPPRWRAFQLAFLLLNLRGIAEPNHPERRIADLLFFPTGGGKTEAYLALSAFALILRRLRHPELGSIQAAGVSIVMRYTLRLLTLDQLTRASGLVCALELERQGNPERYGTWPFEIGLWVGRAATPNRMGRKGDNQQDTARSKTRQFKADPSHKPSPIPLENCPWCGAKFTPDSFELQPNDDHPDELRVACSKLDCDFSGSAGRSLPIVAVDEPIYRRLPAFLIATVDKFASLPWVGESGKLLGGATHYDAKGFYGAAEPRQGRPLGEPLPPPDLVIQDELHLISGPLGTMVGLYETAIDGLCLRQLGGHQAPLPKFVASTATVRRAQDQIQAVFARESTFVFPPPGPDRRDSFFAKNKSVEQVPGRLYVGVVAPGRSAKVLMRRTLITLMSAAESAYRDAGGKKNADNPADPYMTLIGYFMSLRELGGARRILEEEIRNTIKQYGGRLRVGEKRSVFADRQIGSDVIELTSRVSTNQAAEARRRLEIPFHKQGRVDSAIATNMISVGLDIPRLGLMTVLGQPKTHAEYIQATSRVGRDDERPGLVVTLLNVHKPRDRSHYERFRHYHETFYRSVESASVTPFSTRALDRGLPGMLVALARHMSPELTPSFGPERIKKVRATLEPRLLECLDLRLLSQGLELDELDAARRHLRDRAVELLDAWEQVYDDYREAQVRLKYQKYEGVEGKPLLRDMLDQEFESHAHEKFRANRSLRDVEAQVNLHLRELSGSSSGDSK